jgi:hypothetical protein
MAVGCQTLTLGAFSSRSALSMLVGALFKKFGLFFNTPRMSCKILELFFQCLKYENKYQLLLTVFSMILLSIYRNGIAATKRR